jgi:hypothetical protein
VKFVRKNLVETVLTVDNNLARGCFHMLESIFLDYAEKRKIHPFSLRSFIFTGDVQCLVIQNMSCVQKKHLWHEISAMQWSRTSEGICWFNKPCAPRASPDNIWRWHMHYTQTNWSWGMGCRDLIKWMRVEQWKWEGWVWVCVARGTPSMLMFIRKAVALARMLTARIRFLR